MITNIAVNCANYSTGRLVITVYHTLIPSQLRMVR